jgi:hypothetical protein
MAVRQSDILTPEQLENNYEYKVVKRAIKKEYPWVIDVIPPSEDKLNEYNLIFIDLLIDPYKLQQEKGWELVYYLPSHLKAMGRYYSPYLSTIFDIPYPEGQEIPNEIERMAKSIKQSPALPNDLKLPRDRNIAISGFVVSPSIPDDVILSQPN